MPGNTVLKAEKDGMQIPCCPQLEDNNHCDVIQYKRILSFPVVVRTNDQQTTFNAEVIYHFRFTRCTKGLSLGDPVYSTTLLPGEKVRLATTDRRSTFSFDSESSLSYRTQQISEEQYYMTAMQSYMNDASAAQSGQANSSDSSKWDFHGDAHGSLNILGFGADASSNASGSHNSSSSLDYLNEQRSHVQSSARQAASATHVANSISIGSVDTRTHSQGESEDHFEASSREFANPNHCHAVTYLFYRLNKRQIITFELIAIERRINDPAAPVRGSLINPKLTAPVAPLPQSLPATSKEFAAGSPVLATNAATAANLSSLSFARAPQSFGTPISDATRKAAIAQLDTQLAAAGMIDKNGVVSKDLQNKIFFQEDLALPTAGIIVKGCLDECNTCEPLVEERLKLENDLLRKQIELLEKSQEYRCCPVAADTGS
jgi:hypothetical protein